MGPRVAYGAGGVRRCDGIMEAALAIPALAEGHGPVVRMPVLLRRRAFRVVALIAAGWVLGLADLVLTLTYLMNVGLFEGNPLARWIIAFGSPWLVVGFKLGSMVVSSGILFWQRRRWQAELGAILAVVVLARLTMQWMGYIAFASDMTHAMSIAAADPVSYQDVWATLR